MAKLTVEQKLQMWEELEAIQEAFPYSREGLLEFADICISELIPGNPRLNRMQADILTYLLEGPKFRMVEAQRGQAKTTLAGIFGAFKLIHEPHLRVVIFSQNAKRATEISGWVVKIFKRMDFLSVMLPDKLNGDKDSTEAFEIHHVFKGSDKSPSVACYSITSGAQGARADFLIADDIESLQNSRTVANREWLEEQSKEFESINQKGDILYLGTPQSMDSIYNNLPGRGYDIRIWPGRYPSADDAKTYGEHLAPIIERDLELDPSLATGYGPTGLSGAPTCPEMFPDEALIEKEVSQGKAKFQLQYMLNTRLTDADRFPLKVSHLIVTEFSEAEGPVLPVWNNGPENRIQTTLRPGNRPTDMFYRPIPRQYDWNPFARKVMYVDPSGGGANGDETAYAIVFQLGNLLYLYDMGGVRGGYEEDRLMPLVESAKRAGVHEVYVEKNYGNGALAAVLRPLFQRHYPVTVEDDGVAGQKELRIIDTLEPLLDSHRLVVRTGLLSKDEESTQVYPAERRKGFQLFAQISNITRDKGCLKHDDRIDALSSACRKLMDVIDYDDESKRDSERLREAQRMAEIWRDPIRRRQELTGVSPNAPQNNAFAAKNRKTARRW